MIALDSHFFSFPSTGPCRIIMPFSLVVRIEPVHRHQNNCTCGRNINDPTVLRIDFLASLCAMTLIVGCGGSSSPGTTTCDGGNCSDAKGDTGSKLDWCQGYAGCQTGWPSSHSRRPGAVTHDGPVACHSDGPVAVTPDGPVAVTPDGPVAVTPDGPAANSEVPAANPDVPSAIPRSHPPIPTFRPPDVTSGQDVRPPDTITPLQTDAADAAADTHAGHP